VERVTETDSDGYVVFALGATTFAVAVSHVREIIRAVRLDLLPDQKSGYGRGVALVDARGRSIPVVDLRSDTTHHGDVLLPLYRHHVGLVVDRVVAVQTPLELLAEVEHVPEALPSYARGVLRPAAGGDPVLLIELPDAAELARDADRPENARLGADILSTGAVAS
jgi:chemotaxis signal transduction protein